MSRDLLKPYADHVYEICGQLAAETPGRLRAIRKKAQSLTTTNCGWGVYQIAPLVISIIDSELACRKRMRKAKVKSQ